MSMRGRFGRYSYDRRVAAADDPDAAREHVGANLAPFAAAAALAAIVTPIATDVDWGVYTAAVALGTVAGLSRLPDWRGPLRHTREVVPSMIFLLAVALLRASAGGANSGIGIVALLPVFWTALHGDRRQLSLVVVCVALFFLAPLALVGPPEYPSTQYRAGVLFVAVSAIVGFTTQWLVSEVRFQASEAGRRERALGEVARVMRGLSSSVQARAEVCEAARSIADAGFAFLYEPVGVDGTLRLTAVAGIEITPLEVDPNVIGTARDAFLARRAYLWTERHSSSAIDRDLWGGVGQPASLLFEPVLRGEDAVGMLVVGWSEEIAADSMQAALVAMLAHEVATAIERGDLLARMTDMASTDPLTGLPNRRAWDARLREALLSPEAVMLAMLDLDHFKDYNDTNGHPAGDRLLRATAAAWREELRAGDFLARVGGEEFALLLPATAAGDARRIVERLRARVPYQQTCSAGLIVRRPDDSAEMLMDRADEALYASKAAGRDRITVEA